MLLTVQVQPVCTFRERFVLFRRFWFHVSLLCLLVRFIILDKMLKVPCCEDFIFCITNGKLCLIYPSTPTGSLSVLKSVMF